MKIIASAVVAASTAIVALTSASAYAAPSGGLDAGEVVMQLQSQGSHVVVNRTGTQPLSECTVTGVRPGQTYSRYDSGYPGAQNDPVAQIISMTVYVDAQC